MPHTLGIGHHVDIDIVFVNNVGGVAGMRAVVQRVSRSHVFIDGEVVGQIERGLLVLLGITHDDTSARAQWLAEKIKIGRAHV